MQWRKMIIINNNVKEIKLYKSALIFNKHHDKNYIMKRYLEIEFFDGKIIKLNVEAKADISNCDYLIVMDKGNLIKTLFINELA